MRVSVSLDSIELDVYASGGRIGEETVAAWILEHRQDELKKALSVQLVDRSSSAAEEEKQADHVPGTTDGTTVGEACPRCHSNEKKLKILDCISQVQRMFLERQPLNEVFQFLLSEVLQYQESEYAFIGELEYDENGKEYMTVYSRASSLDKQNEFKYFASPIEFRFYNMHNLFGECITGKVPVIANDAPNDPRAGGTPPGHPTIHNFLGIPFMKEGEVIGMVGIANRTAGYSQDNVNFLEPFLVTCSSIIQAYAHMKMNTQLINTLEQKVEERTKKLQCANEELETANRRVVQASQLQLQHFACMSHEIRTPLNCIIGLSSLLDESEMTPMQHESVRMIMSSGDLLLTVVNDVLDYSKLETGNVEITVRRSNLQETLNAIIHSIQTKAASKNVRLRTYYDSTVPEFVQTDCRRLQQILYNLLGNAIKFSPEGGLVDLGVHVCRRDEAARVAEYYPPGFSQGKDIEKFEDSMSRLVETATMEGNDSTDASTCSSSDSSSGLALQLPSTDYVLRFVIKDYGQGIDPRDYERIFQPFRQASSETERVHGGTGLGLPITAKLVHGLGGTISVTSETGAWSRFTVDLPFLDKPLDQQLVTSGLEDTTVFVVGEGGCERAQIYNYFDSFKLDFHVFDCAEDFSEAVKCKGFVKSNRKYICLIQERCYDDTTYGRVKSRALQAVLLTFGPDFSVQESHGHFRSLCQVLPSVLVNSMLSFIQDSDLDIPERLLTVRSSPRTDLVQYRNYMVLVAEDNKINQKVLLRILNRIGIKHVDVVDNGKMAVEAEATKRYDVILMDMQMPVMDGLEATRRIMVRPRYDQKPPSVVFVTAHVSSVYETQCEKAGGIGFLSKPFNVGDLVNTFQTVYLQREVDRQDGTVKDRIE